jgi:hypothetical protein
MFVDMSSGRELDRVAKVFGVHREPARLFGVALPWGQRDETLRARIWSSAQEQFAADRQALERLGAK